MQRTDREEKAFGRGMVGRGMKPNRRLLADSPDSVPVWALRIKSGREEFSNAASHGGIDARTGGLFE